MRRSIYAIFDTVAGEMIGSILLFASDAPATRLFMDVARDGESIVSKHLQDFDLVHVGDIEGLTLIPLDSARVVVSGAAAFNILNPSEDLTA